METIENFRAAIINLYNTMDRGFTEGDIQLLNIVENSPSSFQFAIQEISLGHNNNFQILFESTKIVTNFVRNRWSAFNQDDKSIIIQTLLNFIVKSNDKNSIINKVLVCISDIIAFEFQLFGQILPQIPPHLQLDFMIILIEELKGMQMTIEEKSKIYGDYLASLCPLVLQMLNNMPLSVEFLKLSKSSLSCITSYDLYQPFMNKFETAINNPSFFPYCVNFVRTILINGDPFQRNESDLSFIYRIMKFSIALSFEYVKQRIYDIPCEIWNEVANFSPDLFKDTNFSQFFLTELLKFVPAIPVFTSELQELFSTVCYIFTSDELPTYTEPLIQLFHFILLVTDCTWSHPLGDAVSSICSKFPNVVFQIFLNKLQNPTPGLFIAACQCYSLPEDFLLALSCRAIEMKNSLPLFHLLVFINKIGLRFPNLYDNWLMILIECFPNEPIMSLNNLISLFTNAQKKNINLIPKIPNEFLVNFIQYLDLVDITTKRIWYLAANFFNIIMPLLPPLFLEKLLQFLLKFTQESIINNDFEEYFYFISELNRGLGFKPDALEFKKNALNNMLKIVEGLYSSSQDPQQKTFFIQKLSESLTFIQNPGATGQ